MKVSILIPALNEAENLSRLLPTLQVARRDGHEVILCDGGSQDDTLAIAAQYADRVLSTARGRALQMNTAAQHATGSVLIFLHADTQPPPNFATLVCEQLKTSGRPWGHFDVALDTRRPTLKLVQAMMNRRSRWTGIATGDQTIFLLRGVFLRVGGYPNIALMEDIALSRALKKVGPPIVLHTKVRTSARRWEQHGIWRTILTMWRLRLAYWLGADPDKLAAQYYGRAH